MYHEYQLVDKNPFITTVDAYVGSAGIVVTKELYPSNLPKDVGQQVIWVQENVPKELIARCLAQLLAISDMSTTQCILYQRSKYTDIPYAKPSITKLPHIHCITEKPLALQLLRPAQILSDSFAFKHLTF